MRPTAGPSPSSAVAPPASATPPPGAGRARPPGRASPGADPECPGEGGRRLRERHRAPRSARWSTTWPTRRSAEHAVAETSSAPAPWTCSCSTRAARRPGGSSTLDDDQWRARLRAAAARARCAWPGAALPGMAERGLRPGRVRDLHGGPPAPARSGGLGRCCAPPRPAPPSSSPASSPADGVTVNCVAPGATDDRAAAPDPRGPRRRERPVGRRGRRRGRGRGPGRPAGRARRDRRRGGVPGLGGGVVRERDGAHGRRRTDGDRSDGIDRSGPDFTLADFLGATCRHACGPATARPLVVHADELEPLPAEPGAQPDPAVDRRHPADDDVRDVPADHPAG